MPAGRARDRSGTGSPPPHPARPAARPRLPREARPDPPPTGSTRRPRWAGAGRGAEETSPRHAPPAPPRAPRAPRAGRPGGRAAPGLGGGGGGRGLARRGGGALPVRGAAVGQGGAAGGRVSAAGRGSLGQRGPGRPAGEGGGPGDPQAWGSAGGLGRARRWAAGPHSGGGSGGSRVSPGPQVLAVGRPAGAGGWTLPLKARDPRGAGGQLLELPPAPPESRRLGPQLRWAGERHRGGHRAQALRASAGGAGPCPGQDSMPRQA